MVEHRSQICQTVMRVIKSREMRGCRTGEEEGNFQLKEVWRNSRGVGGVTNWKRDEGRGVKSVMDKKTQP